MFFVVGKMAFLAKGNAIFEGVFSNDGVNQFGSWYVTESCLYLCDNVFKVSYVMHGNILLAATPNTLEAITLHDWVDKCHV